MRYQKISIILRTTSHSFLAMIHAAVCRFSAEGWTYTYTRIHTHARIYTQHFFFICNTLKVRKQKRYYALFLSRGFCTTSAPTILHIYLSYAYSYTVCVRWFLFIYFFLSSRFSFCYFHSAHVLSDSFPCCTKYIVRNVFCFCFWFPVSATHRWTNLVGSVAYVIDVTSRRCDHVKC